MYDRTEDMYELEIQDVGWRPYSIRVILKYGLLDTLTYIIMDRRRLVLLKRRQSVRVVKDDCDLDTSAGRQHGLFDELVINIQLFRSY